MKNLKSKRNAYTFFLPKPHPWITKWIQLTTDHLSQPFPAFNISDIKKIIETLRQNQTRQLSQYSLEKIISVLDQTADLWLKPSYPMRKKAEELLSLESGCSQPLISQGLTLAFKAIKQKSLQSALPQLSSFPRPKLTHFIFAGIIPTPMLFDIFLGLMLQSAILIKVPSRAPFFPILLAQSIHQIDPKIGECIAALWWPGGKTNIEKTIFENADLIHAYGDDKTIEKIQSNIPLSKNFLSFGHKVSFAVIGKEALTSQTSSLLAKRAAYDICLYDQQGCVSPHVIYIEKSSSFNPRIWTQTLAHALKKMTRRLPASQISLGEASSIHQTRGVFSVDQKNICLSSHPTPDWTVIYEENPEFHPSCLNRTIFIKPIQKISRLQSLFKKSPWKFQAIGHAVSNHQTHEIEKLSQILSIPFLRPIGSMQKTSFQAHLQERLQLLETIKKA